MKISIKLATLITAAMLTLIPVGSATAIQITYMATDLADTGSGDLWQYSYVVSDHSFQADTGFTILFDANIYGEVQDFFYEDTADGFWNLLSWNPDPTIPDDGAFDAFSNNSNPSLPYTFDVEFTWVGAGTPGAQGFELYYDGTTFDILESGFTTAAPPTAPIPEPATMILLGTGLLSLAGCSRRIKN